MDIEETGVEETETEAETEASAEPELWNPTAAANWCIIFTPIFSAFLHARNWEALGDPERAKSNWHWMWISIAFILFTMVSVFLPESRALDYVIRVGGVGIIAGWYFAIGKPQIKYVKQQLGGQYTKKGWGIPFLAGVSCTGLAIITVALGLFIQFNMNTPTTEEFAEELQPILLEDFQRIPPLKHATIEHIQLIPAGETTYSGYVQISINGQSERLPIEAQREWYGTFWEPLR